MQLRKVIAIWAAGLACCAGLTAATTPKKKPAHRKTTAAEASKKPVRKTTAAKSTTSVRRKTSSKYTAHAAHGKQKARSNWRTAQTAPTPDRYKEIQTALATKGYLHGEPNGVWSQDSADALRRFQQDQNLQASGKLDSLSLIALGLGPKH